MPLTTRASDTTGTTLIEGQPGTIIAFFELARGEFFKWNSAGDFCAHEFLAFCVAALDQDRAAMMATSESAEIDEVGNFLESVSVANQTLVAVVPVDAHAHLRFRQNISARPLVPSQLQSDPFGHSAPNGSDWKLGRFRSCFARSSCPFGALRCGSQNVAF